MQKQQDSRQQDTSTIGQTRRHQRTFPPAIAANTERPAADAFEIDLAATILAVVDGQPQMLVAQPESAGKPHWEMPTIALKPGEAPCLGSAFRKGIRQLTGIELGHVEQLEARFSAPPIVENGEHSTQSERLSISYTAVVGRGAAIPTVSPRPFGWLPVYAVLPWEDWRSGRPALLSTVIEPLLETWASADPAVADRRRHDVGVCFGTCQGGWDEEKVAERLNLLVSSGCLAEIMKDQQPRNAARQRDAERAGVYDVQHLSYAAGALGRLRSKIKVEPIIFEMVPDQFTLYELQQTVEALLGSQLHKQNFRRLVEHMGLVEPTGEVKSRTGGRPAQLFRFRPSVVLEQVHPGMRVRGARL